MRPSVPVMSECQNCTYTEDSFAPAALVMISMDLAILKLSHITWRHPPGFTRSVGIHMTTLLTVHNGGAYNKERTDNAMDTNL